MKWSEVLTITRGNPVFPREEIHWDRAVKDVSPFLERSQDVNLLTLENVKSLLLNK
jgi:hypothetical protein